MPILLLCSRRRRCLSFIVAAAANSDDADSSSAPPSLPSSFSLPSIPNPFRSRKKEEDAKNLLKGMFEGKGDPLSLYDNGGPGYKGKRGSGSGGSGGGGGSCGGGGGSGDRSGGGDSNPLDLVRAFFQRILSSLGAKARGVLKVLLAVFAFGSLFVALPLAKPTAVAGVRVVNWAMRLDSANPRARLEKQASARKEQLLRAEAEAAAAAAAERGGGGEPSSSSSSSAGTTKLPPASNLLLGKNEARALAKYGPDDLSPVVEAAAEAARRAAAEVAKQQPQKKPVVVGKKGR